MQIDVQLDVFGVHKMARYLEGELGGQVRREVVDAAKRKASIPNPLELRSVILI